MNLNIILTLFSGISFLVYGIASFNSKKMIYEFARWGYEDYRYTIGGFQLLGGIGLIIGLYYAIITSIASFGLTLLMIIAILVRIKIKDKMINVLPALFYAFLNLIILYNSLI